MSDACNIALLLVPHFAMMPFTAAIEPLRAANRLSGRTLYRWRLYSTDGAPVQASNGISVMPFGAVASGDWPDLVFVCASLGAQRFADPAALAWLREQARRGIPVGGISSGSHVLARAGLLAGYRCTIHWEDRASFEEAFPDIAVSDRVFEIDRGRYTCSGGTAALDLMLHLIGLKHGRELALAVSEQFIHDRVRTPGDSQRQVRELYLQTRSPRLAQAVRLMQEHLETPLSLREVAARVQVTPRQLERLFLKYHGCTPRDHYLSLRLERARQLLTKTGLSTLEVALAAGFASPSHFARCYRAQFGHPPRAERAEL